jgi:hypothetical protein
VAARPAVLFDDHALFDMLLDVSVDTFLDMTIDVPVAIAIMRLRKLEGAGRLSKRHRSGEERAGDERDQKAFHEVFLSLLPPETKPPFLNRI